MLGTCVLAGVETVHLVIAININDKIELFSRSQTAACSAIECKVALGRAD